MKTDRNGKNSSATIQIALAQPDRSESWNRSPRIHHSAIRYDTNAKLMMMNQTMSQNDMTPPMGTFFRSQSGAGELPVHHLLWMTSLGPIAGPAEIRLHRTHQHSCSDTEEREASEHLDHHHHPRRLRHGGDVAEAHGGEDGDGEVEGVGTRQGLGERARLAPRGQEVRRGEQDEEVPDRCGKCLDPA